MKWFKHITDSLDDPFISNLIERYGGNGYMIFFGVIEIYAREFKVADDWKLIVTVSYLKRKLQIYRKKTLIDCLKTIRNQTEIEQRLNKDSTEIEQRLNKDSGKWEVEFYGDEITIFIPKFRQLMDESTLKKLREKEHSFRNRSGIVLKSNTTDADADADIEEDKESTYCAKTDFSFFSFELFWNAFGDKRGKEGAIKSWHKISKLTEELAEKIIEGAKEYALERKDILAKGGTPKMAQGWLSDQRWKDEIITKEDWKEKLREEHGN